MRKHRAACLLLALTVLSGCGSSGHSGKPSASPTAAASWKFTTLDLGIPDKALKAPVTGRVPDDKTLHVGVTLKVSDDVYHALGAAGGNKPYTDVVTGNNLYYPATAGFDLSTGLGTPNLNTLVVNRS